MDSINSTEAREMFAEVPQPGLLRRGPRADHPARPGHRGPVVPIEDLELLREAAGSTEDVAGG